MALPEQLRKQKEAIEKMYAGSDTESGGNPPEGEGTPTSPEADESVVSAPESASNEQTRPDTTTDEGTFEKRYKTLQGMYNADTARLRADNQALNARLAQVENLLATLSARPAAATQQTVEKLVTDKDLEEYGDSIGVMRRVSKEETSETNRRIAELEQTIRNLQTNIVPRVEQVAHKQAKSAEQLFWSEISTLVPDWRDVNGNKEFHSWLLEVDSLTGVTRQSYLEDAQRNLDARRVANFFKTWQGISGQSVAQSPRDVAKSQLEKQVAPGKSRASAPPQGNQPKTYTKEEIAGFFNDVRRGAFKGRETERDRIERDIFAAQAEGRIVATG